MSGLWLAIDTATDVASVALGSAEGVRAARVIEGARRQSAALLPLIDEVFRSAAARIDELSGVVVGDGPGSFTGLRIGWSVAKALVQDRGLPLYAVPSLLAVAHAASRGDSGPVAACFDALRGQLFGAVYGFPPGRVETLVAPGLFTAVELTAATPTRPIVAVGDGAARNAAVMHAWTRRAPLALAAIPSAAASLVTLVDRPDAARPIGETDEPAYGRPAEAQAKWEARHGRPLPHPAR